MKQTAPPDRHPDSPILHHLTSSPTLTARKASKSTTMGRKKDATVMLAE